MWIRKVHLDFTEDIAVSMKTAILIFEDLDSNQFLIPEDVRVRLNGLYNSPNAHTLFP